MFENSRERLTVRSRVLWRCLLFALLALLAGVSLMAGHAFASGAGTPAAPQVNKVSNSAGQPGQSKPANPNDCLSNYQITQSEGATPVAGTTLVAGSQCDDCLFSIALPFPYTLYNHSFS